MTRAFLAAIAAALLLLPALADGPPGPEHSHPNGADWIVNGAMIAFTPHTKSCVTAAGKNDGGGAYRKPLLRTIFDTASA